MQTHACAPPADHADAYFALKEGLETLFGQPVDLVTEPSMRNPFLIKRVQEERPRSMEADSAQLIWDALRAAEAAGYGDRPSQRRLEPLVAQLRPLLPTP